MDHDHSSTPPPTSNNHRDPSHTVIWEQPRIASRVHDGIQWFMHNQITGGVLLILSTVAALIWANSPWQESYHSIWHTRFAVTIGSHILDMQLHQVVNDGLMAIFFFVIGLEVKREVKVGELASARQAALPIAGAIGGMIVPALIFTAFNFGGPGIKGWGVPMATDIAFALGVLSLFGRGTPVALKVFLAALAIADDMGAVLVIAFFYTASINWLALGLGLLCIVVLAGLNFIGVRRVLPYALIGLCAWLGFYFSGVHATIAGILVALTIPSRQRIKKHEFVSKTQDLLYRFVAADVSGRTTLENRKQQKALDALRGQLDDVHTPLSTLEHGLHSWNTFLILPIFALSNAGVHLGADTLTHLTERPSIGIILGLFVGKPVGILALSWLAITIGIAVRPADMTWKLLVAVSVLAGIGFTMSLFIANLAFSTPEQASMLTESKAAILLASTLAGIVGAILIRLFRPPRLPGDVAKELTETSY